MSEPQTARIPFGAIHGLGCSCYPHVSQQDFAALGEQHIETARLEYLEGRKAVARDRASLVEQVEQARSWMHALDDGSSEAVVSLMDVLALLEAPHV